MAVRTTRLAPVRWPSQQGYSESPLRNVQLQSDVRPSGRKAQRSTILDDHSRRTTSSTLQSTIYDALGSSEPVDLLPYISKRASTLHRGTFDSSLEESPKTSTIEDETPATNPMHGTQPRIQEQHECKTPSRSSARVLEEVLYATPPGSSTRRGV
jgi:hypothetical protein